MFFRSCDTVLSVSLILLTSACATPLANLVDEDAPGYRVKAPAVGDAQLGRRLIGDQPETNMCFVGDTVTSTFSGWSTRTAQYDGFSDADLKADFGETLRLNAGADASSAVRITLKSVTSMQLNSVFFNAEGPCSTDNYRADYARGKDERVITRALKAGSVSIGRDADRSASVSVDTNNVGGSASASTTNAEEWQGTNLYFADYPEKVRVSRQDLQPRVVAVNQTVDLGSCGFTLTAVQQQWQGRLSCQGGSTRSLTGSMGDYVAVNVAPGVSYSVRIESAGVAQGTLNLHRYNVVGVR